MDNEQRKVRAGIGIGAGIAALFMGGFALATVGAGVIAVIAFVVGIIALAVGGIEFARTRQA